MRSLNLIVTVYMMSRMSAGAKEEEEEGEEEGPDAGLGPKWEGGGCGSVWKDQKARRLHECRKIRRNRVACMSG